MHGHMNVKFCPFSVTELCYTARIFHWIIERIHRKPFAYYESFSDIQIQY